MMGTRNAALAAVLVLATAVPGWGAEPVDAVLDETFQTELPLAGAAGENGSGSGGGFDLGGGSGGREGDGPDAAPAPPGSPPREAPPASDSRPFADLPVRTAPPLGAGLAQLFFWTLGLAALVALVVTLAGQLRRARVDALRVDDAGDAATARKAAAAELPRRRDLDALVAAGRYAEAVHLLLRLVLARLGHALAPSLTSREVLYRPGLGDGQRQSLTVLVEAVERSLFGGRDVTREEYARCVEAGRQLLGGRMGR